MFDRNEDLQSAGSAFGLAALLAGAFVGAAALLLATDPGRRFMAQIAERTEDWKAQAAAAIAETREKVVSAVESETPLPPADHTQQVRRTL